MRALALLASAAVAVALLVTEAAMQPQASDRASLLAVFVGGGVATWLVGWWLVRAVGRSVSLAWTLRVIGVAAVVVASGLVALAATTMFLSSHDLRLVLIALLLGASLAIALTSTTVRSLTADLRRLVDTARTIGAGGFDVAPEVHRRDEVGALADAIAAMGRQLDEAARRRDRDDQARRRFLVAVSHDLRTPLTSIRAAVEAVQDGIADDPDRYLTAVADQLDVLSALVDDLLVLARIDSGVLRLRLSPTDVGELVEGVVEALRPVAARREVAVAAAVDRAHRAEVDPSAVSRVLRNLVDNAVRHAPRGGHVEVVVGRDDGAVTVDVRDDGPGFTPQQATSMGIEVVDKPGGGGTGLGLAIAGGIVRAHGGRLELEAGPGGRCRVVLPVEAPT